MKHLDLFAGTGGFTLAAKSVWGEELEHVGFVDFDPYCQALLKLRFPNTPIHGDIKTYKGKRGSADLITGGFPCQPFSQAGKRGGTSDDRHLWPEMLRVIREVQPRWVIGENVAGLTTWNDGMVFDEVLSDLEAEGYETVSVMVPAVSVNAPHRRDRIWIVAYSGREHGKQGNGKGVETDKAVGTARPDDAKRQGKNAPDTHGNRRRTRSRRNVDNNADVDSQRRRGEGQANGRLNTAGEGWSRNWPEVATELCGVDDGLPAELDGFELSKSRHRTERLKGLGNAIVPQVAAQIMVAIKEIDA